MTDKKRQLIKFLSEGNDEDAVIVVKSTCPNCVSEHEGSNDDDEDRSLILTGWAKKKIKGKEKDIFRFTCIRCFIDFEVSPEDNNSKKVV